MTEEMFLEKFVDVIDTDAEINLTTELADLEDWDSLSVISFLAFSNSTSTRKLTAEDLKTARTVGDLFKLVAG